MFSFMKKDKEKDKKKEEKVEKKKKDDKGDKKEKEKKERQNITVEEMTRLEDLKKGVFRRFSDREKKKAKSAEHPELPSPTESEGSSGSSTRTSPVKEARPLTKPQPMPRQQLPSVSKNPPPAVLPKPKVKSILKGKGEGPAGFTPSDLDDTKLLQENTKRNEDLFVETSVTKVSAAPTSAQIKLDIPTTPPEEEEVEVVKLEPYASKLKLPPIIPVKAPRVREITVKRNQAGGFGFSLRKGVIPEQGGGEPKVVTFAEPGSGHGNNITGLLPGDRLVEVSTDIFLSALSGSHLLPNLLSPDYVC